MTKAYHSVGSDDWPEEDRVAALHEILDLGEILPASIRFDREEMRKECFGGKATEVITKQFGKASPKARAALKELAEEKLEELPESGLTHSLFNCSDLLVGDLSFIFLRPGGWYDVDNGFVFDAEELLMKGAAFRPTDLLGSFHSALKIVVEHPYRSVTEAREEIEAMIRLVKSDMEFTGRTGISRMKECLEGRGICKSLLYEIVWPGVLPTSMAIEVWEEGKRVS